MKYLGKCKCGNSSVMLEGVESLGVLKPRICDCEYCKKNPSALVSGPNLTVTILSLEGEFITKRNGSGQAEFYQCRGCNQLLAVGTVISGQSKGALNANLLDHREELGTPIAIQPRLLSSNEKVDRWSRIWGILNVRRA